MAARSKIGLGTVQFGLDYGVSNAGGQVPEGEAASILEVSRQAGITLLDTSPAYGNAESVIGRLLRAGDSFALVTKTASLRAASIGDDDLDEVRTAFEASLRALGVSAVAGLLVHQADDLLKPGGDRLYALLEAWREAGRVGKIGVSVYDRQQIDRLVDRYRFDLVQLPLNIFDQRLVADGTLEALASSGVEIHARSIFLQGLLLMDENGLPEFFAQWRPQFRAFRQALHAVEATPLEAALSFARQTFPVAVSLLGVHSVAHLNQCLAAYDRDIKLDWSDFAVDDVSAVDPRRWPARH